jgi:hypothetical protein
LEFQFANPKFPNQFLSQIFLRKCLVVVREVRDLEREVQKGTERFFVITFKESQSQLLGDWREEVV